MIRTKALFPGLAGGFLLAACGFGPEPAQAQGLQVSPVSVTIEQRSSVLRLANGSERALRAQVRVYRWSQEEGEDELSETQDLLASPPFVNVEPGNEQIIRLVRANPVATQTACEQTFRIIVDELPAEPDQRAAGLNYALRYSVPVYLKDPACDPAPPSLTFVIESEGDETWLKVTNSGETRAQLANIAFTGKDGSDITISPGLLGYVLAGAQRRFKLAQPAADFTGGGQIQVQVNGTARQEPVSLAQLGG